MKKKKKKKRNQEQLGHYEAVKKTVSQYVWVEGDKPSGLPGSFVVSEDEAKKFGSFGDYE